MKIIESPRFQPFHAVRTLETAEFAAIRYPHRETVVNLG